MADKLLPEQFEIRTFFLYSDTAYTLVLTTKYVFKLLFSTEIGISIDYVFAKYPGSSKTNDVAIQVACIL